ncbi:MAG: hypothetical protein Q9M18_00475 [Mariprofundaceae bacterium]|nr:hypothetical protein [Mariprofundaceae bacterium]
MMPSINDWQARFSIANQTIAITANDALYAKDIAAFVRLYAPCQKSADISFDFLSNGEKQYLILDGQYELWQGSNAPETVAAFEIQLYTQVIQRIYPHYLSLHAGCISTGDEAWMFAGQSGAGKSSITTAALLNGCQYMTDEFSLLDEHGFISAMPRPMQWDEPEHPAFSHRMMLESTSFERELFVFPDYQGLDTQLQLWLPTNVQHEDMPLTRLIFPRFDASALSAQLSPLRRSEALMQLAQHFHQNILPSERIQLLNQRIPENIQACQLVFSDVHAAWDALIKV